MTRETNGVIYFNRGKKCIVRLILCIQSLRRFYDGPITVFIEGEQPSQLLNDLKRIFQVDFISDNNPNSATLVRKIEISQKSPYDITLFIDADMLILGDISEFFDEAKTHDLVASHFTDWKSNGGTITRRIKRFSERCPTYINAAIKYGPAINTGIYAYPKNSPIWKEWWDVATWGQNKGIYIPDEVACQVIAPQYNCKVLSSQYNVSVIYGEHIPDKRVIHYHGRKHCKEFKLCELWIKEFIEACKLNLCHIQDYTGREFGDRRLSNFLKGKYGWDKYVAEANKILGKPKEKKRRKRRRKVPQSPTVIKKSKDKVTFVTACDVNFYKFLEITLPNWIKYKTVNQYPLLVYVNGFNGKHDPRLSFIRQHPRTKIVEWDLPGATSQRERMLNSFVLGTAKDVETDYWVKLDADSFAVNYKPLLSEEMFDFVICGHKWHYTKPGIWIKDLDKWASDQDIFKNTPDLFEQEHMGEKRYIHERTASYVQLHASEFVRFAAKLANEKLPVPSHDTYLWYVAKRLGLPIKRHNFKRFRGMTNVPRLPKLKQKLNEVELNNLCK